MTNPEGEVRIAWKLLTILATALALSFVAAIITSKLYWGYFFSRPTEVDPRIVHAHRYVGLTSFRSQPDGILAATSLVPEEYDEESRAKSLKYVREDPYYGSYMSILEEVERRGELRSLAPVAPSVLAQLLPALRDSGVIVPPDPGYESHAYFGGIALHAQEQDGTNLMFVAASGGQVSNDHYPNYQLLFEIPSTDRPRLLSAELYFVDVAGIEVFEWPIFWALYFIPCLLLSFVILALYWVLPADAGRRYVANDSRSFQL